MMTTPRWTLSQAATALGVSERTIRNYLARGFLTRHTERGRRWVDPVEVEALRETEASGRLSHKDLAPLLTRLARLERTVETLVRLMDGSLTPLGLTPEAAATLRQHALDQLAAGSWSREVIQQWVPIFLHMDDRDLAVLRGLGDSQPYARFLDLCSRMQTCVAGMRGYATSLELQELGRELARGRQCLKEAALLDIHTHAAPSDLRAPDPLRVTDRMLSRLRGEKLV